MSAPSSAVTDYAIAAALTLCWSSAFIMIDTALAAYSPAMIAFLRIAIAAVIATAYLLPTGQKLPQTLRHWGKCAALGFFGFALPFTLVPFGQNYVNSATAAVLMAFSPISTLLLAHVLTHDERLTIRRFAGVVLGFCGILILFIGKIDITTLGIGTAALICAAFSYAAGGIVMKSLRAHSDISSSAGATIMAAIWCVPALIIYDDISSFIGAVKAASLNQNLAILWLAVISTALPTVLVLILVRRRGATFAATSNYGVPVMGVVLGAVFAGDAISWNILATLALVLGAMWLARSTPG